MVMRNLLWVTLLILEGRTPKEWVCRDNQGSSMGTPKECPLSSNPRRFRIAVCMNSIDHNFSRTSFLATLNNNNSKRSSFKDLDSYLIYTLLVRSPHRLIL